MKRRDYERHKKSSSDAVAAELTIRAKAALRHHHRFELYEMSFYDAERVERAYLTAQPVANGLPPESLQESAITETLEVARQMSERADKIVGRGQDRRGRGSVVSDTIDANITMMARHTKMRDLPEHEVAIYRMTGVPMTRK